LANQPKDFTRLGVALQGFLGEDPAPIHVHLEHASGGLDQAHVGIGEGISDFGRQTGGPWFVVSDDAVFDGDGHVVNDSRA
jgi:hypothetical protein